MKIIRMKNGQYVVLDDSIKKPKTFTYIVLAMTTLVIVSLILSIAFINHSKKQVPSTAITGCGHKIPTIDNHTFCVGYNSNGVYYYNDKLQIIIK